MKSFTISSALFAVAFSGLLQNAVTAPLGSAGEELDSTPEYKLTLEEMKEVFKTLHPLHGPAVPFYKTAEDGPVDKKRSIIEDIGNLVNAQAPRLLFKLNKNKEQNVQEKKEQEVDTTLTGPGQTAARPDEGKSDPVNDSDIFYGGGINAVKPGHDKGHDEPVNEPALLDGKDLAAAKAHGLQPVVPTMNGERVRNW